MTRRRFIDTNLLVSARDPGEPAKLHEARAWSIRLASTEDIVVGPRVVDEFRHAARRKLNK